MEELLLLKRYIGLMEKRLGLDVIIYDEFGLLSRTPLANLPQVGKWHRNPYCLKIKENKALHRRCVSQKPYFVSKAFRGTGAVKGRCHCGVVEYAVPVRVRNRPVCIVAATGFLGELRETIGNILGKRVGLEPGELQAIRERSLSKIDDEESVIHAMEILAELLERYLLEKTQIPSFFDASDVQSNEYVLNALEYIRRNFATAIDVNSVATHCHISASYLQHLFSGIIGHGIAEEIRLCRLSYAKELLCTTEYSMRYISFACGFESSDYFFTVFKRYYKISPLQYRKGHRT